MKKQWGANTGTEQEELNQIPIIEQNTERYNIEYPTLVEIFRAIRKLKRRKAPGPDEIPTGLLKELRGENLEEVQKILSIWWNEENIEEEEELKARVVLIYKKRRHKQIRKL